MKKQILLSAMLIGMTFTPSVAQRSSTPSHAATRLKAALAKIVKMESAIVGNMNTDGMDMATTKPSQTTTYSYSNGTWEKQLATKTEYNSKGYTTATETVSADSRTRAENTYDDTLEGFVTKTTQYSWDEATSTWTNPVVTSKNELTRDNKGRVTKEVTYTLNEETNTLEKESEIEFGYALIGGKLNSISTTITEEEEGVSMTIPVKVNIQKWYRYDENKLFNFSMDDMGMGIFSDKDNMIENATLTMTIENFPMTGTIKGTYTDNANTLEISLMGMMKVTMTNTTTDDYGSYETTISMSGAATDNMTETIKVTNNEYGDCTRIETTGTDISDTQAASGQDLGDIDIDDIDMNQTLTMDYEYLTTSDNGVLKKSMTVYTLDKATNEAKPTSKTTYDSYIDYVSGTSKIEDAMKNALKTQNKAFYSLNGAKVDNLSNAQENGLYIVKEGDKTYKIKK